MAAISPFSCAITARSLSISDDVVRGFPSVTVGVTGVSGVIVLSGLVVGVTVVSELVTGVTVVSELVTVESVAVESWLVVVVLESVVVVSELVVSVSELVVLVTAEITGAYVIPASRYAEMFRILFSGSELITFPSVS